MTTPTILVNTSFDLPDGSAAEGWKLRFQLSKSVAVPGASGAVVAGDYSDVIVDADGDDQVTLFRNKAVDDGSYYIVSLLKPNTKNWIKAGFVEFEDVAGPVNLQDVIVTQDPGTLTAAQAAVITANDAADRAATSATNAATSEANAAASATEAATSETNAATSEANAATSETNAATSEANAAASEANAAASAALVGYVQHATRWQFAEPIGTATTYTCSYPSSGVVSVGWSTVRLIDGLANSARKIPDRAAANLTSGQCLYLDLTETYPGDPGYTVTEAAWNTVENDIVFGSKLLLVANQDGNLYGILAERLRAAKIEADAAVTEAELTEQARLSRHEIGHKGAFTGGWIEASLGASSSSVVVAWDNINILQGQSNSGRNIADLASTTLSAGRGLYYDAGETYSASPGYTVIEADVSSVGNDTVTGDYIPLLLNVNGRLFGLLAGQVDAILQRGFSDEVVVVGSTDTLYIHQRGDDPRSNRYIRWTYQLSNDPAINSAVWRVALVEEVERTGLWSFSNLHTIVGAAEEFEFAVKESGAHTGEANAGFVGGLSHGNHTTVDVAIYVDGEPVTPSSSIKLLASTVDVYQQTQLWYYDYPSHSFDQNSKLGLLDQHWRFEKSRAVLDQTVEWERSITTAPCFMGMLPFDRADGADFVSNEARRAPRFASEDISTSGTQLADIDAGGTTKLFGTLALTGEITSVVTGDTNNPASWVARQSSKNKVYTAVHRGAATGIGETIRAVTTYKITTGN